MSPKIILTHSKDWNWHVRLSTKITALSQQQKTIIALCQGVQLFLIVVTRCRFVWLQDGLMWTKLFIQDWPGGTHHCVPVILIGIICHTICFLVAFSIHHEFGSPMKCYHRKLLSKMNENKWYIPPHWMQRVKDELKTLNVRERLIMVVWVSGHGTGWNTIRWWGWGWLGPPRIRMLLRIFSIQILIL